MDIYLTPIPLKTCPCCGVSKEISLFNKSRATKDGLQYRCKDCYKAYQKARYHANPEKVKAYQKARYQANPEKQKARAKAYYQADPEKGKARWKARKESNKDEPWFIVMRSQGDRIPKALKGIKRAAPAQELVGGWVEMATHIESQFQPGMTWENHGSWHIDHIKPCASFDFNYPEQQRECFHWSNTQPLWAADNISKGTKV